MGIRRSLTMTPNPDTFTPDKEAHPDLRTHVSYGCEGKGLHFPPVPEAVSGPLSFATVR